MSKLLKAKKVEAPSYQVLLSARGNPDFREDPDRPPYGCAPDKWVQVGSLRAAVQRCQDYIAANDLGGGNWTGGEIQELPSRKFVGRVSYNGRVWADKEYVPNGRELTI